MAEVEDERDHCPRCGSHLRSVYIPRKGCFNDSHDEWHDK